MKQKLVSTRSSHRRICFARIASTICLHEYTSIADSVQVYVCSKPLVSKEIPGVVLRVLRSRNYGGAARRRKTWRPTEGIAPCGHGLNARCTSSNSSVSVYTQRSERAELLGGDKRGRVSARRARHHFISPPTAARARGAAGRHRRE